MKAVILNQPNDFSVQEMEKPVAGNGDIVIKMQKAAICGTDMRILNGTKRKGVRYPSVIGHEISGIVEEVGKDVEGFQKGDRVAVANVIACHTCHYCRTGHENICANRKAIGYEFNGGFEEYVLIPEIAIHNGNLVRLPDHVTYEEGALIEPLSCCLRGMKNAGVSFGDRVLIIGAGPIGLMHLQLAKQFGADRVYVSEPNDYRREIAASLGADVTVDPTKEDLKALILSETEGLGVDKVIMAIGSNKIVDETLDLIRKGGTLNLFAGFADGISTLDVNKIHYNEIVVNGSSAYKLEDYYQAAQLVFDGKIDVKPIVTHRYKVEDFQAAYEMSKSGKGLKIVIEADDAERSI